MGSISSTLALHQVFENRLALPSFVNQIIDRYFRTIQSLYPWHTLAAHLAYNATMSSNIRRHDLLERLGIEQLPALEAAYDPVDWFLDGSQADCPFRTVMTVSTPLEQGVR